MPPIATNKYSRLIFKDLRGDIARLRSEGTAFVPHSVRVLRTRRYNFLDEPYVESVHFSRKACPYLPDNFESDFSTNNLSRSEVSFFVDKDKPDCALPVPNAAHTFLNLNEQCAKSVVPNETVIGMTFEPLCMVVVIAPDSRKDLFDDLLAAGRPLIEKLRISVNYTVGLRDNPSVESITANCQSSILMNENHRRDQVLQDKFTELASVREKIRKNREFSELLDWANDHTLFFQPPSLPPPPPPPPFAIDSPPAPPMQLSLENRQALFEHNYAILKAKEAALMKEVSGCVGSGPRDTICGLSTVEAPNPWISKSGSPCRGFDTLSARFGDFCGCDATIVSNASMACRHTHTFTRSLTYGMCSNCFNSGIGIQMCVCLERIFAFLADF